MPRCLYAPTLGFRLTTFARSTPCLSSDPLVVFGSYILLASFPTCPRALGLLFSTDGVSFIIFELCININSAPHSDYHIASYPSICAIVTSPPSG
ncbi:hypothetical protein PAXRUDRAFT_664327 [Paxillus rubicundulus Ve08.2h10]|uniref:Uncharacterized protein n=1 Tax=Paxillus rubicundulus Ve08.2h10 TaxID=930991 RepID=A0A0D0DV90_9AGAM|nr:hypothetical protein PAXRUDRAFT_664327 [Paxillus rubicundulus Ve08.2h10]